ncbi:MAG TPA: LemA family protein [bacterium]|nr:LemA family protein [bacterium]
MRFIAILLGGIVAMAVVAGLVFISGYNRLVSLDQEIEASWAQVENQYQRRANLIPNLVETVKGYAEKEQAIFTGIAESRAKIGSAQTRPERMQAETELGGFLSRLLMITENYPQLKASEGFQTLQAQLEGTENRIATERQRYIQAVKEYNIQVRRFPSNFIAGLAGFLPKETFEASERDKQVPKVDFGTSAPQPQSP